MPQITTLGSSRQTLMTRLFQFFPLDDHDLHAILYRDQLDPIPLFKRALNRAFRLFVNLYGHSHAFSISNSPHLSSILELGFRDSFEISSV